MMGSYPGHTLNVQPKSRLKPASVRVLPWVTMGHALRFVGRLPSKHSGGGGENAEARGRMERKNGSFILWLVILVMVLQIAKCLPREDEIFLNVRWILVYSFVLCAGPKGEILRSRAS